MTRIPRAALMVTLAGAGAVAARRIASAPPDAQVAARAEAAEHSGPWRHGYATVNGVRLHYAEMGEDKQALLILLHGFPECWFEWRHMMPKLAQRFHVIAPDMRGYNRSDKPQGIGAYSSREVAMDIVALIEHFGQTRAHVVGHDWGGEIAWELGQRHPEHVSKLVVINAPHPGAFARELMSSAQFFRSLYALYFQIPTLSEATARLFLRSSLRSSAVVPGAFDDDALDVYENGISQPGAATAMLNYYRAVFREGLTNVGANMPPVEVTTLLLWGMKDFALTPALTEGLDKWVPRIQIERIENCGHWVPEEQPTLATDRILAFLVED